MNATSNQKRMHHAWWVLIGCCFLEFGTLGGMIDAGGVFFVPIAKDLGISRSDLSLYMSFNMVAAMVGYPLSGILLRKFDTRKLLPTCVIIVVGSMAAMSFYHEPWQWWVSGLIYGFVGSILFMMTAPVLITNWFRKKRAIALGIGMSFSGIGGAVLSPLFAAIIEMVGWRTGYLMAAAIILILVLPWTLTVLRFKPADMGVKPYGWTDEDERITEEIKRTRHEVPGVPFRKAVRSVPFVCMFFFCGLISFFIAFNMHLPGHGTQVGLEPVVAATLISAVMVGNVTEKVIAGFLNDRIGVEFMVNIELAMVMLGLTGFIFIGNQLILLYVCAFFFGAQNSLVSVSTPTIIRQLFGEKDFVKILAFARIGLGIGSIGPFVVGLLFDMHGTFIPSFIIGSCIAAVGIVVIRIAYACRSSLPWEDLPDDPEEALKIRYAKLTSSL